MASTVNTDVLIIGGGLSGLSLAVALIEQQTGMSVAVVEPRSRYNNDRTWSFWGPIHHRLDRLVARQWSQWSFGLKDSPSRTIECSEKPYQSIESIRFYRWAKDQIEAAPNVGLYLGETIERCHKQDEIWSAASQQHQFNARLVVDTRPPSNEQLHTSALYQCFVGQVIEAPGGFDPDCVELMTDMASDEHGLSFTYCLPLSADQALVEFTRFAAHPIDWPVLETDLQTLKSRRGWLDAPVTRTERGVLPMGMPARQSDDPSYVYAGTSAGGLRAATGYGFWRIQRWAQCCAWALDRGQGPLAHPPEPKIQGWMDDLFLRVLRSHPRRAPELFFRLHQRVPAEVLIRFLSDESNWIDKLKVVLSLPKRPFLAILLGR